MADLQIKYDLSVAFFVFHWLLCAISMGYSIGAGVNRSGQVLHHECSIIILNWVDIITLLRLFKI